MASLWQETSKLPAFPRLEGEIKTQVLIVGGGLAGLLCAWHLEQAGVDYVLVEAETICHGVTGNTTAKITSQHGRIYHKLLRQFGAEKTRLYYEANEAALEKYRRLCRQIPCDFEEKDAFVYALNAPRKLEKELEALQTIGARADFVQTLPLPLSAAGAVRFPGQGQFHPLKFAAGIARGLNIYEHSPVRGFDGRYFVTDHGRILAGKAIVTSHFPFLNKHGAYFLKLYQHRSYVLALEGAEDVGGMYLDEAAEGLSFRNYGDLLLLGGGSHRSGKPGGGWQALEDFAQRHYPRATVKYRWATQDTMSLDGVPYIGQYGRKTPRLYVAAGFNKWGMTSAMAAAMLLCDLVQNRPNPWEELFCPARSMLRPQLAANALEAGIGLVTPTRPRCPHMGCALKWNAAEQSWDCPCHGSRFGPEGELLQGPATGDLKKK